MACLALFSPFFWLKGYIWYLSSVHTNIWNGTVKIFSWEKKKSKKLNESNFQLLNSCRSYKKGFFSYFYPGLVLTQSLDMHPLPRLMLCHRDSSITLGATTAPCVVHFCFEHSFHGHALERVSRKVDSWAASELQLRITRNLQHHVCSISYSVFFPEIIPSLLLVRSFVFPTTIKERKSACKPSCSILSFHVGLVC